MSLIVCAKYFIIGLISSLFGSILMRFAMKGFFSAKKRGPYIIMEKPEELRPEDPHGIM